MSTQIEESIEGRTPEGFAATTGSAAEIAECCLTWWLARMVRKKAEAVSHAASGNYAEALQAQAANKYTEMCIADLRWALENAKPPNGCKLSDDHRPK